MMKSAPLGSSSSRGFEYEYSKECFDLLGSLLLIGTESTIRSGDKGDCWKAVRAKLPSTSSILVIHDVALCLLADASLIEDEKQHLDATLDACGTEACLVACSRILTDLSSLKNRNSRLITSLPLVLRTIRRQYLSGGDLTVSTSCISHANSEANTAESSSRRIDDVDEFHDTQTVAVLSQMLLRLPVLISNACHGQKLQLPAWAVRDVFFSKLVRCNLLLGFQIQQKRYQETTTKTADTAIVMTNTFRQREMLSNFIIRRMVQTGGSPAVAQGIWAYKQDHHDTKSNESFSPGNNDDPSETSSFVEDRIWDAIPTQRDRLKLLEAILDHQQKQQELELHLPWREHCEILFPYLSWIALPCLNKSGSLAQQFAISQLLSKPSGGSARSNRMLAHLMVLLLDNCRPSPDSESDDSDDDSGNNGGADNAGRMLPILERCTRDIVATHWSTRHFIQHATAVVQRRVTSFLRSSLSLLSTTMSTSSPMVHQIMRGITVRLESSLADIRIDGMRVAELLAAILGEGAVVHFSELSDDHEEEDMRLSEEGPMGLNDVEKAPTETRVKLRIRNLDPDAEYQSSDSEGGSDSEEFHNEDECDDDSLVWDDDLVPLHDIADDEEDLRETRKPMYLRECLELLQTPETHESAASRHETGLLSVEVLVRSQPLDLPDVAVPLAKQLIRMEDKFGMQDEDDGGAFDQSIQAGLLALTVAESASVGDFVIDFLFGETSLLRRMIVLSTLEGAARELSGADVLQQQRHERPKALQILQPNDRVSGNRRLVSNDHTMTLASDMARTRRWGRLKLESDKSHTRPLTIVNRFTSIASRWFYTLIGRFMDRRDDAKLWGGANGARLLSHLLVTLSTFCECADGSSHVLSKDLLEFAWTFRTADDATLRAAVLVAIGSSLAIMHNDEAALVQVLQSHQDLPDYLSGVLRSDPDQVCRQQAHIISKQVLKVLQQNYVDDRQSNNSLL